MCPECYHKDHAMSMKSWKSCENTKISFQCKKCNFSDTREGILWMHLVSDGFDKNGC